jgi:hypothetical protein
VSESLTLRLTLAILACLPQLSVFCGVHWAFIYIYILRKIICDVSFNQLFMMLEPHTGGRVFGVHV